MLAGALCIDASTPKQTDDSALTHSNALTKEGLGPSLRRSEHANTTEESHEVEETCAPGGNGRWEA